MLPPASALPSTSGSGAPVTNPPDGLAPTVATVASGANGDTVRLSVQLGADQANMYAIFGDPDSPMSLPPAYQSAAPFGVDIGGVAWEFVALSADAGTDSWLTVGYVDGFSGSDLMASPGTPERLDFWTPDAGVTLTNDAVFRLPDNGASGSVVIAQLTVQGTWSATLNAQGRNNDGTGWEARGIEFSGVGGGGGGGPAPIPADGLAPTVTTVDSGANGDTVWLSVQLGADQANMYAIFGHQDSPMSLPPAYQLSLIHI